MAQLYSIQNILAITQMGFFALSFLSKYWAHTLHEGGALAVRINLFNTGNMNKYCTVYAEYFNKWVRGMFSV